MKRLDEILNWLTIIGLGLLIALAAGCATHEQGLEDWFKAKNAQLEVLR